MKSLIAKLSKDERKVVPHLESGKLVQDIAKDAGVQVVEAMRACQWLVNKGVLRIGSRIVQEYELTMHGEHALRKKLPEIRFLEVLDEPKSLKDIQKEARLSKDELNASIGILKKAGAIDMADEVSKIKDVDFSEKQAQLQGIKDRIDQDLDKELVTRGLVERKTKTMYSVTLTKKGRQLKKANLDGARAERVTPQMLKKGSWKNKQFRHYDVTSRVPETDYGRKHFVQDAISSIKQVWTEMGFTEMTGSMTQTAYWDLDALFVPQDHPAREMQDTFYLRTKGKLPKDWKKIKAVHEDGGDTGSTGWQTPYSKEEAERVLLRTHTTALSAKMLAQMREEGKKQGKFFSVAKVFRNEALDWKHLFEFHQVEGIVVGKGLTLADLIGLQKEFYLKMGYTDIRFRPAYFPYTEPSCEVEAFHPKKKEWVELGGMGVFRPEVVIPLLGEDIPVLAWGLGMERIITEYYGIDDLRQLYDNNLKRLRKAKQYVRRDS